MWHRDPRDALAGRKYLGCDRVELHGRTRHVLPNHGQSCLRVYAVGQISELTEMFLLTARVEVVGNKRNHNQLRLDLARQVGRLRDDHGQEMSLHARIQKIDPRELQRQKLLESSRPRRGARNSLPEGKRVPDRRNQRSTSLIRRSQGAAS